MTIKYNNHKPWLSEGLKLSIRTKNKLYLTYVKQKYLRNELWYKSYRIKLNHTLRIAERNYYAELLAKHKSNLKKVWGVSKSIVNKNKAKRVQEKFKVHDDSVITDRDVISTRFNDYFIEIGPNLAKKIPNPGSQPKFYLKEVMVNSMFIEPVTDDEIHKIVISLNNSAPGYDDVNAQVLKLCITDIRQPLCYLCNRSLIEGIFPCEMKIANVLLLYKSGDPMLFNNSSGIITVYIVEGLWESNVLSTIKLSQWLQSPNLQSI